MSRFTEFRFKAATTFQRRIGNPVTRRLPFQTLLETTGRTSGLPRVTPLGGRRIGNEFWLVSDFGEKSQYVRNIKANPRVRVQVGGRWHPGPAHLLPDDDPIARLRTLAELEHHSTALRTAFTSHVPGMLQTADHAREIFRHVIPAPTPPEVEHRISYRVKRQDVVYRADPNPYSTVIHEAALHMRVGGRDVARAQLRHLLDMSERDHITLRVLPFDIGAFPGSGQSINYLCGPVPQLDTVQLDQFHGPMLLDAEAHLEKYRRLLDTVEAAALAPEKSRDLILAIAQNL